MRDAGLARWRAWLPLAGILVIAGGLRLWNLAGNGFGRTYYAAAAVSMQSSWSNVLYNAFDPAGFVSLDKPPVAIWMQALGVKLLGVSGLAMHLPQVAMGLGAIVLVYLMVTRTFGAGAGLCAAALLALTPVSIAVDRSNNTESCLILVLLGAVWVGMRAAETGRAALLCLSMALIGVGFNVKMAAALVLAPTIVLAYVAANRSVPVRGLATALSAAGVVLVVSSLWWCVVFDLTPAERRPYAGSTTRNSMLELALVHNGASRFTAKAASAAPAGDAAGQPMPELFDASPAGPLRLFRPRQGGQAAWWLPLALAGIVLWHSPSAGRGSREQRIAIGVWTGWLATFWVVLSFAGGTVHTYYLAVLAPPLAALSGIGAATLWQRMRTEPRMQKATAALLLTTIAWQTYLLVAQCGWQMSPRTEWIVGVSALCGLVAIAHWLAPRGSARKSLLVGTLAAGALLSMPLVAALSVVLVKPNVAAPFADPSVLLVPQLVDPRREAIAARIVEGRRKLVGFLERERGGARYLAAVPNALVAAPLILDAGAPVIAMGGYLGDDPILTPERLAGLVARGELRFVMIGGFTIAPDRQAARQQAIETWARANGRPVDPGLWRLGGVAAPRVGTYRAPLGDRWVAMPVPELFDMRR